MVILLQYTLQGPYTFWTYDHVQLRLYTTYTKYNQDTPDSQTYATEALCLYCNLL